VTRSTGNDVFIVVGAGVQWLVGVIAANTSGTARVVWGSAWLVLLVFTLVWGLMLFHWDGWAEG
jgi:hypothetical protein